MKALRTLLTAIVLLGGALTMNAQRMSIVAMQSNARFLTDRMAYTLGIRDPYLIDEIYRINYDYIWGVNDYLDDVALGYYYDDYIAVCEARDLALRNLLGISIWNRLIGYNYFYRPIVFANRGWHFSVYDFDRYGPRRFYFNAPRPFHGGYAGGHFFHGMAPRGGRPAGPAPGMAPRAGMTPRGGMTPAPGGMNRGGNPRGGNVQDGAPRGNTNPRGNVQPNAPQGGQNYNGRSGNAQPQNRPQVQPQGGQNYNGRGTTGGMNRSGAGSRSDNNMRSSSRSNATAGATRVSNASMTRVNAAPSSSRGNAGGPRGGRR